MTRSKAKIKIVLIHPPLRNVLSAATPDYVDENRGHTPPMGLLYLQAALEKSRHESLFLDANLEGMSHDGAAKWALEQNPDIVGLQAMTFTMPDAYFVAKAIKKLNRDVKVIIGGPHSTIYPRETVELEAVDFAFAGEGEESLVTLLNNLNSPESWKKIPGLTYKKGDEVYVNSQKAYLSNLDTISFPARSSSKYDSYSSVLAKKSAITIMITSRGCPFQCIFCNRMGRTYRYHSAEYVLREIKEIIDLGIKEIFIHDDTFTLRRERVVEICEGILKRGYKITWEARTRVDCVDEELLGLMKRAGCHRLSFGVESGSEKVLRSMRKGTDLEKVKKVFDACRREGIVTLADFMFGNLDETEEDIEKTMRLIKRLNPDYAQFSICSPYPDTPLYKRGLESGLISNDIWMDFAKNPLSPFKSPVWTQHFTEERLIKITSSAYKSFYMRPSFILKQLAKINSVAQFKKMVKGAIGMRKS